LAFLKVVWQPSIFLALFAIGVARILSGGALFPQKVDDHFSRRLRKTVY